MTTSGTNTIASVVPRPCQYIGSSRIGATAYAPAATRPAPVPHSAAAAAYTLSTVSAEMTTSPIVSDHDEIPSRRRKLP